MSSTSAVLIAVVVGVNAPSGPGVAPLRFADDDAVAYAALLRDAGAEVTLLTTLDADSRRLHDDERVDGAPSRAALAAALEVVAARVAELQRAGRPVETLLVYSGHGDVDGGEGFVQLADGRLTRSELYAAVLPKLAAERVHVVVDACKSYFLALPRGAAGTRRRHAGGFAERVDPAAFANVGFLLSTSGAADSHEWEEFGGGVFSHELRSALRGAADVDGDGRVSYAEAGAFLVRANASVPNPRFRPQFTVVPPTRGAGPQTTLLDWRGATLRSVALDAPLGHVAVEDSRGRRLLDAHPGAGPITLHLPARALYLRRLEDGREYPLGDGAVRLSQLTPLGARVARRGALALSFGALFATPFSTADVAEYLARPAAPPPPPPRNDAHTAALARWSSLGVALGAAVAGVGCLGGAAGSRNVPLGASQLELAAANRRIGALDSAATGLFVAAAVALTASVVATVLERRARHRAWVAGRAGVLATW